MTKKDYVKFADLLNTWNKARLAGVEYPFDRIVEDICGVFARDNYRFDYERFKDAVYKGL